MENKAHEEIWGSTLRVIQKELNPQSYQTWFIHTKSASFEGNVVTVETPNSYFRDWLIDHYAELVEQAVFKATNQKIKVRFVVGKAAPEADSKKQNIGPASGSQQKRPRQPEAGLFKAPRLNPKFAFENFVVGSGNRFAHAAADAVSKSPAKAYNPLFIYGGVGMGKTHLLQATANHIWNSSGKSMNVIYMSSERFTNQLITSIQTRSASKFRQTYRNADALLIDDVQFIAGKESTQEEFFHTFNTLYDAHKQIILSSDRPPKEIASLEDRLISRFEWGLVTDMQPPDLETRIAILRKKIEQEPVDVPDDVTNFIAEKVKTNIRELEGALIRVIAYSSLIGEKITLSLTQEILKDMLKEEKRVSVDMVQWEVSTLFDISISDLRGKKRSRSIAYPRQVAMYLSRTLTEYSLPQIGEYFGGRDHTTVLHACQRIEKELKRSRNAKNMVSSLVDKIKG